ncbi:MAG: M55 family metallopeptidase [Candidatus Delongbacteria bacterium]|nr:M55 family metallopeptidase [Candidatus Delongbacteria bacterium]MBN2836952.1 M55 family metallopeptidase [Candidatus Delongbacteria bacterium]
MKKIFISFDFEGIAGISFWSETVANERYNKIATEQLSCFINRIIALEPNTEIYVADSHSIGNNIIWEDLPENVKLIRGFPRMYYMIQELDDSFSDLVLFGYHTAAGKGGMMDHTYSSSSIFEIRINGKIVDEGLINAALAGEFGVPLSFVYGDDKTVEFFNSLYPEVPSLISKDAISRFSGVMKDRKTILKELSLKAEELLYSLNERIITFDYPINAEITMTDSLRGYIASIIPGLTLSDKDDRLVKFTCDSMLDFYRYLMTIINSCSIAKNIQ